jgi:hypothetical protein
MSVFTTHKLHESKSGYEKTRGVLPRRERIGDLNDEEIALLADAFRALRRDRGQAWNAACDIAEAQGKRRPSLRAYGVDGIKRLARRFGITATHWSE